MIAVIFFIFTSAFFYYLVQCYHHKSRLGFILAFALLIRIVLAFIFQSDIQYYFVLDGLEFEAESWALAQSWASGVQAVSLPVISFGELTAWQYILAAVFYLFGYYPILGALFNCVLSVVTVFFVHRIFVEYFTDSESHGSATYMPAVSLLPVLLLSLYPSFVIWSATNVRDIVYFFTCTLFFYFFFGVFSKRSQRTSLKKGAMLLGLVLCVTLIFSLRQYIATYFVGAVLGGVMVYVFARVWNIRRALVFAGFLAALMLLALQVLAPEFIAKQLENLEDTRASFVNLGAGEMAGSSFAVNYHFENLFDLLIFIPYALVYYFLGPFFWEVSSTMQAFSQLEVFLVYLLIWPTWLGIKRCFARAPFETTVLCVFCLTLAAFQSAAIGNMGTLFRHRTLIFILLSIFAAVGVESLSFWRLRFYNIFQQRLA